MAIGCGAHLDIEVDHFLPGSIGGSHIDDGRVGVLSHPAKP